MSRVRTRIAPSPTGLLHVGTARAALFNELFARQNGGEFVLRTEDTDKERSSAEHEKTIIEGLKWLGLTWDEGPDAGGDKGPYRQSERTELYTEAIQKLIDDGLAYKDEESEAIKLKVEEQDVEFDDLVRGKVIVNSDTWGGDFVIARSIDDPVFHLAVVVDDATMEITHVIRGEDHLTNTARHILIQRALGYDTPQYAHLPLLLDENRKKLSKRVGETSLLAYRDEGFLPEAMLNYLALLGWNPGDDREIFSHEELIKEFSLEKVQKGGAIFSRTKLESINKQYISDLSDDRLFEWGNEYFNLHSDLKKSFSDVLADQIKFINVLKTEQGRMSSHYNLAEFIEWASNNWIPEFEKKEDLFWKENTSADTKMYLEGVVSELEKIDEKDFDKENLESILIAWIKKQEWGNGDVLWPMRYALVARPNSPGPFEIAGAMGKDKTIELLTRAVAYLNA